MTKEETPELRRLSRKESAKEARRAAYQRAKEWRANDPKQIAFKAAMKERQKEINQVRKDRRKAERAEEKKAMKARARKGSR